MSKKPMPAPLATCRKCGAKAKRTGQPCKMPAMKNGRCFLHGGKSTGAKTPEGKERCREAAFIHGFYVAENLARWRQVGAWLREINRKAKGR